MGIKLPDDFVKRMEATLGDEAADFFTALDDKPPVSVRFNPERNKENEYLPIANEVPWESDAFYLSERPSFTYDPSFHAGLYYVQEASSMMIGQIIDQLPGKADMNLALDLCAAPGGKTTHLLSKLPENIFVLANEVTSTRLGALRQNIIKWGHPNAAVINYPVETIAGTGIQADIVLVDAPCSGEGLFRKDSESINHWNEKNLVTCEVRQRDIMFYTPQLVKEGGYLIYSTCTYNPGENIAQIKSCIAGGYFEIVPLDMSHIPGLITINENHSIGYQCFPHKIKGEGFFFACLRRTDKTFTSVLSKKIKPEGGYRKLNKEELINLPPFILELQSNILVDKNLNYFYAPDALFDLQHYMNIRPLFELGTLKGRDYIPAHGMSMLKKFENVYPVIELSYEDAIRFLKKETIDVVISEHIGWAYVSYKGNRIGLIKILQNRINNYLPVNLRILK